MFTKEPVDELPTTSTKNVVYPMEELQVDEKCVEKILQNLRPSKSPGTDGLHPRVLKELPGILATLLTMIFKSSLAMNSIPESWKTANITPLFKKGDKRDPSNYRPISLTSVVCKVLERLIRDHLMNHLKMNNLLSNKQYGFIPGRSLSLQLLTVMNDWTKTLDKGELVDVIYLDFLKAFDSVPHRRLIHKLKSLGVHTQIIQWIENFLTGRTQKVV